MNIIDSNNKYIIAASYLQKHETTFAYDELSNYFEYNKMNFVIYKIDNNYNLEIKAYGIEQFIQGIHIQNGFLSIFGAHKCRYNIQ